LAKSLVHEDSLMGEVVEDRHAAKDGLSDPRILLLLLEGSPPRRSTNVGFGLCGLVERIDKEGMISDEEWSAYKEAPE